MLSRNKYIPVLIQLKSNVDTTRFSECVLPLISNYKFNWIELKVARTKAQPVLAEVEARALIYRQDEKKKKKTEKKIQGKTRSAPVASSPRAVNKNLIVMETIITVVRWCTSCCFFLFRSGMCDITFSSVKSCLITFLRGGWMCNKYSHC